MNELATEKTMTVKEVAEATNVPERTIRDCVQRILPGLAQKGKTTHLTEEQVSLISIEANKSHNSDLAGTRHDVTTDLEMKEKTLEVLSWLTEIKQTVLDSGRIIYDRNFTQTGRAFVLNLIGESGIQNQRSKSNAVV